MSRYVFGLGARRGVAASDIVALVRQVAAAHGRPLEGAVLCAPESKAQEPGFHEAAAQLGATLKFLPFAALREKRALAATHSPRVQAMFGVGSVAEAAALAGAGSGAKLVAPRLATPTVACALARCCEDS